jgi:hypothetical protein
MRTPALLLVPLVLLAIGVSSASAAAPARTVRLLSGGSANVAATVSLMSRDGSRAVISTDEALVPQDTNGAFDAYARDSDGTLQLIGKGLGTGSSAVAISDDGDRVIYSTSDADLAIDTDGTTDLYERRRDGSLRMISNSGAATPISFVGQSASGRDVIFSTTEAIAGTGDADAVIDWFDRRADGSLRLVTPGTAVGMSQGFLGQSISADGSRISFDTGESLLAADGDAASDTYTVSTDGPPYALITGGTTDPVPAGMNRAGDQWTFSSTTALVPADADTAQDVYQRDLDGSLHLISGGSANTGASAAMARDDGGSVVFITSEKLLPADGDTTASDLYERRANGTLRLISGGTSDANPATFAGTNLDGSVLFFTNEALVPADTDATVDMYIRRPDGTLQLGTPNTPTITGSITLPRTVNDIARAVMNLGTDVPGTGDANGQNDLYEVTDDGFRAITNGVAAGTIATSVQSADGSRIAFLTTSTIPGTGDSDTTLDAYEADFAVPVLNGLPTVSGNGRAGSTQTCNAPTAAGEGLTVPISWRRDGATIAGATGKTYTPVPADAGHKLSCRVTAKNGIGADTADSTGRKVPPAAKSPKLGGFPIVGTKLSCTSFAGATKTTYRWKRGSKTVRGRTGRTYKVSRSDLGKRVACAATARNGTLSTSVSQRVTVPRQCTVPLVRGLTPAAAKTKLGNAGCRSKTKRVTGSGVAVGLVLGTSPAKGKKRPNGTTVTINVRR